VRIAAALAVSLLGDGLGVDVYHCGADLARDLYELIGRNGGVDDLERGGVGAVDLLLLSADAVSGE
jgi:hypothetical protein